MFYKIREPHFRASFSPSDFVPQRYKKHLKLCQFFVSYLSEKAQLLYLVIVSKSTYKFLYY